MAELTARAFAIATSGETDAGRLGHWPSLGAGGLHGVLQAAGFLFFAFGGTSVANTAAVYSDKATAGQEAGSITQAPNTSVLLYISLIFGFSLMTVVIVFVTVDVEYPRAGLIRLESQDEMLLNVRQSLK